MAYVMAEEYHYPNARASSGMEYYPNARPTSGVDCSSPNARPASGVEYSLPNGRPASGLSTYSFPELPLSPNDLPKPVIPRPVLAHGHVLKSRTVSHAYQPGYEGRGSGRTLSLPAYSSSSSLPSMLSSASTVLGSDAEQDGLNESSSPKQDSEADAGVGLLFHEKLDKSTGLVSRLVQDVLPESDAAKNGVRVGDELVAVNSQRCDSKSMREIQAMILGPRGSTVRIDLKRMTGRFKGMVYYVDLVRQPLVGTSHRSTQATVKELHDLTPEQQAVLVTVHLCTIS